MRTTAGRMTLFVLLVALAACVAASSAHASSRVQFGIQDDAWLEWGPGTLNQRLTTLERLGVPIVRFTLRWNQVAPRRPKDRDLAARSRVRLAPVRSRSCAGFAATV